MGTLISKKKVIHDYIYSSNDGNHIVRVYNSSKLIYSGEYNSDKNKHGYGVEYYTNSKKRYSGDFRNNLYHGNGVLYNKKGNVIHNGVFYEGLLIQN